MNVILWTALSLALGVELRGNLIRGVPCYKRDYQLYCPTAGNTYPLDRIELFIDENKALMKRMYGEFSMSSPPDYTAGTKTKRSVKPGVPDLHAVPGPDPVLEGENMFGKAREARQNFNFRNKSESGRIDSCESKREVVSPIWLNNTGGALRAIVNTKGFEQSIDTEVCSKNQTMRCSGDCGCEQNYKYIRLLSYDPADDCRGIFMDWVDACESKVEVITPFWASNSAGKVRAIVNTQHFEQAIHQEVCSKARTSRCQGDCGCEQKYKWYRLLAYDPDNDCRGIFMDWFLFPSCCVCRCNPT